MSIRIHKWLARRATLDELHSTGKVNKDVDIAKLSDGRRRTYLLPASGFTN
jgi:hypothetical protein